MEELNCKQCKYFHQHYTVNSHYYSAVNCGHCVFPRIKHRSPLHTVCTHFLPIKNRSDLPDRIEVIRFLTTDILQEILKPPLPPMRAEDEGFEFLKICPLITKTPILVSLSPRSFP